MVTVPGVMRFVEDYAITVHHTVDRYAIKHVRLKTVIFFWGFFFIIIIITTFEIMIIRKTDKKIRNMRFVEDYAITVHYTVDRYAIKHIRLKTIIVFWGFSLFIMTKLEITKIHKTDKKNSQHGFVEDLYTIGAITQ